MEKTDKKLENSSAVKDVVKAKEADVKAAVGSKVEEVKEAATKAGAKVEAKAEEAKAAVAKVVESKVEEKAEEKKEAVTEEKQVKKAAAPKRKAGRKAAEKKAENEAEVFVEFEGTQSSLEDVKKRVIDAFVSEGHRASTIKSLRLYLKPVDYSAYYVINDKFMGRVDLF